MTEEKIQWVQVASIPVINVKGLQMQILVNRTKGFKRVVKQHVIYAVSKKMSHWLEMPYFLYFWAY